MHAIIFIIDDILLSGHTGEIVIRINTEAIYMNWWLFSLSQLRVLDPNEKLLKWC